MAMPGGAVYILFVEPGQTGSTFPPVIEHIGKGCTVTVTLALPKSHPAIEAVTV
jgi:hypothetical protein